MYSYIYYKHAVIVSFALVDFNFYMLNYINIVNIFRFFCFVLQISEKIMNAIIMFW